MTIQEQTCTKDQATRLVALGVKPEALFWHMPAKDGPHGEYVQYGWHSDAVAPAYNVAELFDMLPATVSGRILAMEKGVDSHNEDCDYTVGYRIENGWTSGHNRINMARAAAACLIALLENNFKDLPAHWRQDPNDPCADGHCQRGYSPGLQEIKPLPVPTYQEAETPAFKAAWEVMRDWTIQAPRYYRGSMNARGGHVKMVVAVVAKCLVVK